MDEGTTFILYLPALSAVGVEALAAEPSTPVQRQGETVLLVENNAVAREALRGGLEGLNYRVLEAANGQEVLWLLD